MRYGYFAVMIATSTVVMFGLIYLNGYGLDHVFFSQARMWMALVMGATTAAIMIGYICLRYANQQANVGIVIGSAVAAGGPDLLYKPAK